MAKLPDKMPTTGIWRFFARYFNPLIDYLNAVKLRSDMSTIRLTESAGGTTISAINQRAGSGQGGGAGSVYNGYFTAINSGTGKIKVVNGALPSDTVAGYVKLGNTRLPVAVAEFTISASGRIWIYTKNTSGTITVELKNGSSIPAEVRGEDIREIISYDSTAAITQIWQLGEYVITGKAG